jgi:hypothetical protein
VKLPSSLETALARQHLELSNAFGKFCAANGLCALPALPGHLAEFAAWALKEVPLETVLAAVLNVGRAHVSVGLADPCTEQVWAAFPKVDPPRSWPKAHKASFARLPYDLQMYLSVHEAQRDKEVRRSHEEAAKARQELEAIQQPKATPHGDQPNRAA